MGKSRLHRVVKRLGLSIAISAVGVLIAAIGLALFGAPGQREGTVRGFADFERLKSLDYSGLPGLQFITARDGTSLAYRDYPARARRALVLLHASGTHGRQLHPLARAIAASGAARVYVPDIRGHGASGERRGDVDHIGQLEDDIDDLLARIKKDMPDARVMLGGHSSGGGLAVRFMGDARGAKIDGYLLLAPYLGHDAPTTRPNSGGWARPYLPRIIGLSMLNAIGIAWFNHFTAIDFAIPKAMRDGSETASYSYRMMLAFAPRGYRRDLAARRSSVLLLVGSNDDAFYPNKFAEIVPPLTGGTVEIVAGLTHLECAYAPGIASRAITWLNGF